MNKESTKVFLALYITAATITVVAILIDYYHDNWKVSLENIDLITVIIAFTSFAIPALTQVIVQTLIEIIPNRADQIIKARFLTLNSKLEEFNIMRSELADLHQKQTNIQNALAKGIVPYGERAYRTLEYIETKGMLLNRFETDEQQTRNVLFSNQTINLIFQHLKKNHSDILFDIGKLSGLSFSEEIVNYIEDFYRSQHQKLSPYEVDLLEWISIWLHYDSGAGFGHFSLDGKNSTITTMTDEQRACWKQSPRLVLHYSFLVDDDKTRESRLCDFMRGYIKGVLDKFPEPVLKTYDFHQEKIVVEHDMTSREQCVCAGRYKADGCVFHIVK